MDAKVDSAALQEGSNPAAGYERHTVADAQLALSRRLVDAHWALRRRSVDAKADSARLREGSNPAAGCQRHTVADARRVLSRRSMDARGTPSERQG